MFRAHAGLLQPLANGLHQHRVGRNATPPSRSPLSDDFILDHVWKPDELPCFHRLLPTEVAGQRLVKQIEDALLIQLRACAVCRGIPGHDNPRLALVRALASIPASPSLLCEPSSAAPVAALSRTPCGFSSFTSR